jgi:hypothetical protein
LEARDDSRVIDSDIGTLATAVTLILTGTLMLGAAFRGTRQ